MESKKIVALSFITSAFLAFSSHSHGSQLTETYACDTCDYDDARNIAKQKFKPFACTVENMGENPVFGTTVYNCETTIRTIIVANSLTQTAYKFDISATNHTEFTDAPNVVVSNASLTTPEQQALSEFYEIDEEFRRNVSNFSVDSTSDTDCQAHPSHYLTGLAAQRDIRFRLAQGLKNKIGTSSWNDHYVETKFTGFGLDVHAVGGGLQVNWEHNPLDAYATVKFDNPSINSLVFNIKFVGDVSATGHREMFFAMELHKGASLVDGFPIGNFMSGNNNDLTNVGVSDCLIENLAQTATGDLAWDSGKVGTGPVTTWTPGVFYSPSCTRQVKYKTCSTTQGGVQPCTESFIHIGC
ncbi:hypothetical protein KUL152_29290 [Tenacibaculum sp. KUL152]|nr:hypothetical protein KUL152_29290 [Tenacibaculum sp. KUL152]